MSLLNEVLEGLGLSELIGAKDYKITVLSDKAVCFENIKQIKSFNDGKIEVLVKNKTINVEGKALFVKKYCIGDAVICGEISKIEIN